MADIRSSFAICRRIEERSATIETEFKDALSASRAPIHRTLVELINDKQNKLTLFFHSSSPLYEEYNAESQKSDVAQKAQGSQSDDDSKDDDDNWGVSGLQNLMAKTKKEHPGSFSPQRRASQQEDLAFPWVVMIKGVNDWDLKRLGEKYGFPRGFPLLWYKQEKRVVSFGFYPKFDNDTALPVLKAEDYENAEKLTFFRKWSGFLSMVFAFQVEGKTYWTVTSKNSCSWESPFIRDAKRIWEAKLNATLVNSISQDTICICAETMSFNDQVHGARVLKETAIATAVGKGCDSTKDSSRKTFVEFLGLQEVHEYLSGPRHCMKVTDEPVVVTGKAKVQEFMKRVNANRDMMTETLFQKILKDCNLHHESMHKQVLGDVLEGLVLHCFDNNGKKTTVLKYKFPNYTCRTFGLREALQKSSSLNSTDAMEHFQQYVKRWCYSDEGRKYWLQFLYAAGGYASDGHVPANALGNDSSYHSKVGYHIRIADYTVEMFQCLTEVQREQATKDFIEKNRISQRGTVILALGPIGYGKSTICDLLVNKLGEKTREEFLHIDGDVLEWADEASIFGSDMQAPPEKLKKRKEELVFTLGQERQTYTIWCILLALHHGKIPVVSQGGGIFFDNNDRFILRRYVKDCFGVDVRVIGLLPGNVVNAHAITKILADDDEETTGEAWNTVSRTWNTVSTNNKISSKKGSKNVAKNLDPLDEAYDDQSAVKNSVLWRIQQGLWSANGGMTDIGFANMIAGKSVNNKRFAFMLRDAADKFYYYPKQFAQQKGDDDKIINKNEELLTLVEDVLITPTGQPNGLERMTILQSRVLVKPEGGKCGHITLRFGRHSMQSRAGQKTSKKSEGKTALDNAHRNLVRATSSVGMNFPSDSKGSIVDGRKSVPGVKVTAKRKGGSAKESISVIVIPHEESQWIRMCETYDVQKIDPEWDAASAAAKKKNKKGKGKNGSQNGGSVKEIIRSSFTRWTNQISTLARAFSSTQIIEEIDKEQALKDSSEKDNKLCTTKQGLITRQYSEDLADDDVCNKEEDNVVISNLLSDEATDTVTAGFLERSMTMPTQLAKTDSIMARGLRSLMKVTTQICGTGNASLPDDVITIEPAKGSSFVPPSPTRAASAPNPPNSMRNPPGDAGAEQLFTNLMTAGGNNGQRRQAGTNNEGPQTNGDANGHSPGAKPATNGPEAAAAPKVYEDTTNTPDEKLLRFLFDSEHFSYGLLAEDNAYANLDMHGAKPHYAGSITGTNNYKTAPGTGNESSPDIFPITRDLRGRLALCLADQNCSPASLGMMTLHVTVNPGKHAPKDMKAVTASVLAGESSVELWPKGPGAKAPTEYDLKNATYELTHCQVLGTYGIP